MELYEAIADAAGRTPELVVQHTHERVGWVALPPALCSRLFAARAATPLALELRPVRRRAGVALPSDTPCYASWVGDTCAAGCVGVPASLARALGLQEGAAVAVRPLPDAPAAVSVTVEPASEDDWEIVQLNGGFIEETLLTQVGVASPHQPLPIWIRSVGVVLRVTAMVPDAPVARLVADSEIYVAPRQRVRPTDAGAAADGNLLAARRGAGQQAAGSNGELASKPQQPQAQAGGSEDEAAMPLQAVLRVQHASSSMAAALQQDNADATALPPGVQLVGASAATLARCGLRPGDWVRLSGRHTTSLVKFACLVASEAVAPGHLALSAEQSEWVGAPPFSHIRLQRLTPGQRQLIEEAAELQAATGTRTTGSSRATLGSMLRRRSGEGAGAAAAAAAAAAAGVAAAPNGPTHGELAQPQAGIKQELQQQDAAGPAAVLAQSGWLRPAAEAALARLLPVLGFTPRSLLQSWGAPRPGGLLVCGPAGSGKSAMLAGAAAALQAHPECLTYCVTVSCREISAEGASQAQAQILPKVREALDHLPALLIFDDLDVLCPAEAAGADGAASSSDPALVAWLADLLDHLAAPSPDWGRLPPAPGADGSSSNADSTTNGSSSGRSSSKAWPAAAAPHLGPALWPPLAVAASCRDAAALAAPLRAAGRLDHIVSLPAPTAESRAAILSGAAAARGAQLDAAHLRLVAERADGFDAADLEVLLDRALHVAVRRQLAERGSSSSGSAPLQLASVKSSGSSSSGGAAGLLDNTAPAQPLLRLTRDDLLAALEGFTPAAFWGTGSRRSVQAGVEGWADVGGMDEARQALHEALELPTKHARLVAKAPLRLRTGVLLYGPPGCGKTHIVAAAVAAAGVRCITVSGPELLNKYIGASEAAVRDVFVRAAAAAPSVLFFDEFDAIAPQRGHDNTGVTDRVVNQLLTELDGVEGLRGVCVVAATSRPDLIDAALLRPGRLDRLVYCGFPSPLERGQVLRALARGVQLAPDTELDLLGYNAEFYSGADLAALLAEAQLAAVHEALEAAEQAAGTAGGVAAAGPAAAAAKAAHPHAPLTPPRIQQRHLDTALQAARPSVPEAERERLEAIYARFRQDREPGGARSAADKGKGKVTWA